MVTEETRGITDAEYSATQIQLVALAEIVADLPLAGFLRRIGEAEAVTPIVDPTLWMRGASRLEEIKHLAEAAHDFQTAALRFRQRFRAIEERERARVG